MLIREMARRRLGLKPSPYLTIFLGFRDFPPVLAALGVDGAFALQSAAGRPAVRDGQFRLRQKFAQGPDAVAVQAPLPGKLVRMAAPLDYQGLGQETHLVAPRQAPPEVVVLGRGEAFVKAAVFVQQPPVPHYRRRAPPAALQGAEEHVATR